MSTLETNHYKITYLNNLTTNAVLFYMGMDTLKDGWQINICFRIQYIILYIIFIFDEYACK